MKESGKAGISMGIIGGVGFDPLSDRNKGILTGVYASVDDVRRTIQELGQNAQSSRFTIRLFFRGGPQDLENMVVDWRGCEVRLEAAIPLANGNDPLTLAYFGGNTPERRSCPCTIEAEHRLLTGVLHRPHKLRPLPKGFSVGLLGADVSDEDLETLTLMYAQSYSEYIVAFSPETIRAMLGSSLAAVCRNEHGQIVAISMAESGIVNAGTTEWQLVELSETATDPDYLSRGLSQLCKVELIKQIRAAPKADRILVYAESRANHAPVLAANVKLGMVPAGRLDRHCRIASDLLDVPQEGVYGNLFVFYLPL